VHTHTNTYTKIGREGGRIRPEMYHFGNDIAFVAVFAVF